MVARATEEDEMKKGYWNIDTGHGDEIAAGMDEVHARRVAQEAADARGEPVYLYEVSGGDESGYEEIAPRGGR